MMRIVEDVDELITRGNGSHLLGILKKMVTVRSTPSDQKEEEEEEEEEKKD